MPQQLILASTSPYRKQLLEQLNIPFKAVPPAVDEDLLKKKSPVSLVDLPLFLAQKKAESLAGLYPGSVIIGSDQMGLIGTQALGKAGTKDKAIAQLNLLSGKSHHLITAISVYSKGQWYNHVDTTMLHMRPLSTAEIRRYVDLENPVDCSGSYKIEKMGISLFDRIETPDHTAIVGLPLIALCRILNQLGFQVP